MKIFLAILVVLIGINGVAQTDIVANPGEYVAAENYGGKVELKRFLQQEMQYPAKALANKTEGTVELAFVVDRETSKTDRLEIRKSVSPELDAEAIRLYKMLQFIPSYFKGTKVTTYSTLAIKFSVKNYNRYCKKRDYENTGFDAANIDTSNIIYTDKDLKIKPKVLFEDSLENFTRFVYRNLKYPQGTYKLNLTGEVKLHFIVEPTGRITNIKVLKSLGGGAVPETERLLKLLTWQAGEIDGKKVRTVKTFEVNFNLSNNEGVNYVPSSY